MPGAIPLDAGGATARACGRVAGRFARRRRTALARLTGGRLGRGAFVVFFLVGLFLVAMCSGERP